MKLISLNTWGGKFFDPLIQFIEQESLNTDIFCFQEIYDTKSNVKQYRGIRANLLEEIKKILPNFQVIYFPTLKGFDDEAEPTDFDLKYGSAIFVNDSIVLNLHEDCFVYQDENFLTLKKDFSNLATLLQYVNFNFNGKNSAVFNFHGTPFPGDKLDTNKRLMEIRKLKEIIDTKMGTKILVGDFNLLPDTQSIKILESDMRNLIKEFNIQRTRSSLSPYFGEADFQKYADYTFVSFGVHVTSFKVPDVAISDHLPMILEFS